MRKDMCVCKVYEEDDDERVKWRREDSKRQARKTVVFAFLCVSYCQCVPIFLSSFLKLIAVLSLKRFSKPSTAVRLLSMKVTITFSKSKLAYSISNHKNYN